MSWLQPARFLSGPNVHVPTAALVVRVEALTTREEAKRREALATALPELRDVATFSEHPTLAGAIAALADRLNAAAQVLGGRRSVVISKRACALPAIHEPYGLALIAAIDALLSASGTRRFPKVRDRVLIDLMKTRDAPYREITLLARAAEARGIPLRFGDPTPWPHLGIGIAGRMCPELEWGDGKGRAALANQKLATASLLERAGIPTARPHLVRSSREAVAWAKRIGFPVVLKPDRGAFQIGVWPRIRDERALRRAFARAKRLASTLVGPILIEKHHEGAYLRATLVGSRVIAVFTSSAPRVVGDGKRTAEALVRGVKEGARLSSRDRGVLEAILAAQRISPSDVIAKGRAFDASFPNHGKATDVTTKIHPSVRQMLATIGRLFSLPIAGIDLLIESVRAPAKRAVVLEVNAAPTFALHAAPADGEPRDVAGALLDHLFPDGGASARVPVVASAGGDAPLRSLAKALARAGTPAAGYSGGHAWTHLPTATNLLGTGLRSAPLAGLDRRACALLLQVDIRMLRELGLPVDHVDFLLPGGDPDVRRFLEAVGGRKVREKWRVRDVLDAAELVRSASTK